MSAGVPVVACSIVARNYLPYARVLADGWGRHHPGSPLRLLVLDDDTPAAEAGIGQVRCDDLGIEADELNRLRGIYGVAELTCALKPHLLRHLLDAGAGAVLFLDSDTDIHGDLREVAAVAAREGIVLSPHMLRPPPLDGLSPSESEISWTGLYNSGFIAVGPGARPFLAWWAGRLRRDCLFSEPTGVHGDQRWLDFVPSYFPHHVLRDPGVNVAQWNLHERPIGRRDGRFTAGGVPLRTFHFSGYHVGDPGRPAPEGWPAPLRFDPAREPDLAELCRGYGDRLLAAGVVEARRRPYGYARSAGGTDLTAWHRFAYRELVIAAEALGRDIPHPFDPVRSEEWEAMMADPAGSGLLSPGAVARVTDARLALHRPRGDRWDAARTGLALARQLARRLPVRRTPWSPHPWPSDRIRREYAETGAGLVAAGRP